MVECHVWIPWFCLFPSQTNSKYLDHRGHRSHVVKGEWERKYSKAQVRPLPGQSLNNVSGSLSCLYNLDPVLGNPHFLVIGTKMLFSSKHDLSTHTLHKVGLDKENIVLLKRWSNSRANISCWTDMKNAAQIWVKTGWKVFTCKCFTSARVFIESVPRLASIKPSGQQLRRWRCFDLA